MTIPIQTLAILLMIGGAFAATPTLAADVVEGNRGPVEKPASRDLLFTPPGTIAPQPIPQVDADSLSRGLFEPVMVIDDLTTVSFRAGSTTETPASDALRSIFETSEGLPSK